MELYYEPYRYDKSLVGLLYGYTTKTVKRNGIAFISQCLSKLDQKLKHESLILAQDERWRRA